MNTYTLTQRHVSVGETIQMASANYSKCNSVATISAALFDNSIAGFNPAPVVIPRETQFRVIVSGYTPAVLAIVDIAAARAGAWGTGTDIHFLHYDRDSGTYACQMIAFGG